MRKVVALILVGFILAIAAISNPDQMQHRDFVKRELKAYFQEKIKTESKEESALEDLVFGFGKLLGGSVIEMVVNRKITVDNYVFFSLTKMPYEGEDHIIGMGLFGNNFLFKDLEEILQEGALNEKES